MSELAISVENLSKLYRLGEIGTGTISHDLNRWWAKVRGKEDPFQKLGEENKRDTKGGGLVWALKDVSFDVPKGEVLGIIGKNGAGKSTLLKLLSRVTAPTTGIIKAQGRMASLLEVGTGFHPELTGRDNIFLNGAILGMTRGEISRKFDEIVSFSGVERYIDTPVKRYSSGMYVRLAFAVAAHLDTEILIIDEVLAVGDADFQKKCLGKMKDVSTNEGRTVLFVSHQMGIISQLCNTGLLMENGTVKAYGSINSIIDKYMTSNSAHGINEYIYSNNAKNKKIYFSKILTRNTNGDSSDNFRFDESISLEVDIEMEHYDSNSLISITLQDKLGYYISTDVIELSKFVLNEDTSRVSFKVEYPESLIAPNSYYFRLAIFKIDRTVYDLIENICPIRINDTGTPMSKFEGIDYGQVILNLKYST
ncbi:ABC transporter ATP-binding protein [Flavihumibacter sp. ZG627]|uniref:ABC transporter ATP-binding protein n=1 Tax=Flavihumibacter sp. ZG627 TaxID=1463156 RepID=UPI00057C49A2|nr:ABC transporter ATP-binding protein [Flavihumibacter sp. ZG627]KIC92262.1 hypothetical protein HY58_01530 [Flavihumibacter sp. ZG627]